MGRSYKTNCFSALVETGNNIFNHFIQRHYRFLTQSLVPADLKILAIDALQVAVGKENIADAICSAYNGFLSAMEADGTDVITRVRSAIPQFSHIAVNPTVTGTDHTMVEFFHRPKIKGFRPK